MKRTTSMTLLSWHCLKAADALANIDQSRDFRIKIHTLQSVVIPSTIEST